MKDQVVQLGDGIWWPANDNNGDFGAGSCWYGLTVCTPNVPEEVSAHIPERKVLVQAGGNCGFYIQKYAKLFDLVYTFEPDPLNFYCLNLNVTSPNVFKYQACLGDQHQRVSIGRWMGDVGSIHVTGTDGVVPTMLIDDLNLERCDLIHLDIEGFELHALKGAVNTIQKCRPIIALEHWEEWYNRYQTSSVKIEQYLAGLGYVNFMHLTNGDRLYKFQETA
jgi:FkbM family methyltransferase